MSKNTHQLVPVIRSFTELELTGTPTGGADAAIGAKLTELYNDAQAAELAILRFGAAFWAVEQGVNGTRAANSPKAGPGAYGFVNWMRDHAPEINERTARRYRDIAEATAEKFKISDPVRVFSLPASELDQADQDKRAAVVDFIANKSMRGLQLELGILKKPQAIASIKPAANSAASIEEAECAVLDMGLRAIDAAEKALLDKVLWHDLTLENGELIKAKLQALSTQFHERFLKLKHEFANA